MAGKNLRAFLRIVMTRLSGTDYNYNKVLKDSSGWRQKPRMVLKLDYNFIRLRQRGRFILQWFPTQQLDCVRPASALDMTVVFSNTTDPHSYETGTQYNNADLLKPVSIFTVPKEVQIFYISSDGTVSSPVQPSSLHIFQFDHKSDGLPSAILQVGEWIYPLVPGKSPSLVTDYGAYIFPNLHSDQGSTVAVTMPESLSDTERQKFEYLLEQYRPPTDHKQAAPTETQTEMTTGETNTPVHIPRTSVIIGRGIVAAAHVLSVVITKSVHLLVQIVTVGSSKLRARLRPSSKVYRTSQGMSLFIYCLTTATSFAVRATGFIIRKVGELGMGLGRKTTPHLQKHAVKVLPKSIRDDPRAHAAWTGATHIASSSLEGLNQVTSSLEEASKFLARNVSQESVHIIRHKYGTEAGEVAKDAASAVGNVAEAAIHAKNLAIKQVAKEVAKTAGKTALKDHVSEIQSSSKDSDGDKRK